MRTSMMKNNLSSFYNMLNYMAFLFVVNKRAADGLSIYNTKSSLAILEHE